MIFIGCQIAVLIGEELIIILFDRVKDLALMLNLIYVRNGSVGQHH